MMTPSYMLVKGLLFSLLVHLMISLEAIDDFDHNYLLSEESIQHVSCLGLEDGIHWIRPYVSDDDTLPSIKVKCSSGWAVLDYSFDPNIVQYFSSIMAVHDNFATMDVSTEHLNWDEWFKVQDVEFTTSDDCNICQTDTEHANSGFYMTGNYYGCAFATKALCDMDPTTLECYECSMHDSSTVETDEDLHPGLCAHVTLDIDNQMVDKELTPHDKCVTYKWNYLPSLGTTGRYCTCFKPDIDIIEDNDDALLLITEERDALYLDNDLTDDTPILLSSNPEDNILYDNTCTDGTSEVYELYNRDFEFGTFRIRKCGTYRFMEDILLNMNAPLNIDYDTDFNNINTVDNLHWFPSDDQTESYDEYPSHNFIGSFSMGFFAGISVEIDNVIIDLNGYELQMDSDFYLQQRFFSLIELGSKPFISGQGPSNFGNINVHFAENLIIENGVLGLTSHHCIHGNNNKNIVIRNIQMRDFEVSALSLNGFDTVTVHDIEIGPNYQNVPLTSMYTHARFMIQRLDYIPDKEDKFVTIGNNEIPANDIIAALQQEMNDAFGFAHSLSEGDLDDDDDEYSNIFGSSTMKELIENDFGDNLYINYDGLPHGGTLYGMFFNSFGAGVFGLGLAPGKSSTLNLRNINIHDLRNNPVETIRYKLNRGPFNDLLDIAKIVGSDGSYQGTSYSDAQYALHSLIPDNMWSVLGHTYLTDEINEWISRDTEFDLFGTRNDDEPTIKCNSDVMVHLTKGIFGIRIDNVDNLDISGSIQVAGLHNLGALGESELCGNYYNSKNGGADDQVFPIQIGFTGNEVHGISFIGSTGQITNDATIQISDVISATGSVYGVNFYRDNDIIIQRDAQMIISDVHAGIYLTDDNLESIRHEIIPNTLPRTCAIDVWNDNEYGYGTTIRFHDGNTDNDNHHINKLSPAQTENFKFKCITSYDQCSFDYSKLEDNEFADNYLNIDVGDELIDNSDCHYINNDDGSFIGLHETAKLDPQHERTFNLLRLQDERDINNNIYDHKHNQQSVLLYESYHFALYLGVILFIIITTIMVGIWKCMKSDNQSKKNNQFIDMNSERTPLIKQRTPLINKQTEEYYIK